MNTESNPTRLLGAFVAVTSLFFMWGFITVLADGLIPRLKDVFELKNWQAALVQLAWFIPYGLLSIPSGNLLARIGYKRGIVLGLMIAGLGCLLFYPAAEVRVYSLFLAAIIVLASGITILQVAANPYITVLGKPGGAAQRLNLAQAFNSLGTTLAPIVAATWLLSDRILSSGERTKISGNDLQNYLVEEANNVQAPFLFLGLTFAILALIFAVIKLPVLLNTERASRSSLAQAFKQPQLRFGAIAIFFYVGAEVAIGSFLALYFIDLGLAGRMLENSYTFNIADFLSQTFSGKSASQLDPKGLVGTFIVVYWGGAMVGRFVGAFLMKYISPARVLAAACVGAASMTLLSVTGSGFLAMAAILSVGFFNSVMFPTIFSLSIDNLGAFKPAGSGILCTAIVGGAFIPPLVGLMRDLTGSYELAFLLPVICYAVILFFAIAQKKLKPA